MDVLFLIVLIPALVDWVAVGRGLRPVERIAKPLTMIVLAAAAVTSWEGDYDVRFVATLVAVAASLAGDVFLMQERDLFLQGLVSFFVAHVAYIAAFGGIELTPYSVFIGTSLILISGPLFLVIRQGLRRRGREQLVPAVFGYCVVISVMVLTAMTSPGADDWNRGAVFAAASGALLFYASDAMIGLTRFVRELTWAPVAIMVTYHLGQLGLVYALANGA
ncbi:MAG TPA: lysoplasmalogenase [Actinomycetota bacterium]|nr:lysoplasmalogenase [Actinomycetota bacterium]